MGVLLHRPAGPAPARIDIKPGLFPNRVSPRSRALLPVALLSTDTLDPTLVDLHHVRFGPTRVRPVGSREKDIDGDGRLDAVYLFRTDKTGIACRDTSATLIVVTDGGQRFVGADSLQTRGCHHRVE